MSSPTPIAIHDAPDTLQPLLEIADNYQQSDSTTGVIQTLEEAAFASHFACDDEAIPRAVNEPLREEHADRCLAMLKLLREQGHFTPSATTRFREARALLRKGQRAEASMIAHNLLNEPLSLEQRIATAILLLNLGERSEAEAQLNKVLPEMKDPVARLGLELLFHAQGQTITSFLQRIDQAIQADPKNVELLLFKTTFLMNQGRVDAALTAAKAAAAMDPKRAAAHQIFGGLLLVTGHVPEAEAELNAALAIDPTDAVAINNKIRLFVHTLHHPDEVMTILEQGLRYHPNRVDWAMLHGALLSKTGKPTEALRDLDRAVALAPWSAEAHGGRGTVLDKLDSNQEALAAYDRAVALDPQSAQWPIRRGWVLGDLKRFDAMEQSIRTGIALNPAESEMQLSAYKGMAMARFHQYAYVDATEWLKKALAIDADDFGANMLMGDVYYALEQYKDAIPYLRAAVKSNPNHIAARRTLAQSLGNVGQYAEALALCDEILQSTQDSVAARTKGFMLTGLKRFDEALRAFDQALAWDPNDYDAWRGKGHVLLELHRFAAAAEAFAEAVKHLRPTDHAQVALHYEYGDALERLQRLDEALVQFQQALQIDPTALRALLGAYEIAAVQGRMQEALALANRYIAAAPASSRGYMMRSHAQFVMGQRTKAATDLATALKLDPNDAEALALKAFFLSLDGRFAEALALTTKAMHLLPDAPIPLDMHGTVLCALHRIAEGIPYLERAVAFGHPPSLITLGKAYLEMGRPRDALRLLTQAVQIYGRIPYVHFLFGMALYQNGEPEKAVTQLTEAQQKLPSDPEVSYWHLLARTAVIGPHQSLAEFQTVLARFPNDGALHALKGFLHHVAHETVAAEAAIATAMKLSPKEPGVLSIRAWVAYEEHADVVALNALDAMDRLASGLPHAKFLRALIAYRTGKYADGIALLTPLLNPESAFRTPALYLLAALQIQQGDITQGAKTFLDAFASGNPLPLMRSIFREVGTLIDLELHADTTHRLPPSTDLDQYRDLAKKLQEQGETLDDRAPFVLPPVHIGPLKLRWFDLPLPNP